MNLIWISGRIVKPIQYHQGPKGGKISLIDIQVRSSRDHGFEWQKLVCFGRLAERAAEVLQVGMWVMAIGGIERKAFKGKYGYRKSNQIHVRHLLLPLFPEDLDWLQVAMLVASEPNTRDQEPEKEVEDAAVEDAAP